MLTCVRCVVNDQREIEGVELGNDILPIPGIEVVVYKGESLCIPHFNIVRGWTAELPRHTQGDH